MAEVEQAARDFMLGLTDGYQFIAKLHEVTGAWVQDEWSPATNQAVIELARRLQISWN